MLRRALNSAGNFRAATPARVEAILGQVRPTAASSGNVEVH